MRLSFSYVTEEQIAEGIARFARFVRETAAAAAQPALTASGHGVLRAVRRRDPRRPDGGGPAPAGAPRGARRLRGRRAARDVAARRRHPRRPAVPHLSRRARRRPRPGAARAPLVGGARGAGRSTPAAPSAWWRGGWPRTRPPGSPASSASERCRCGNSNHFGAASVYTLAMARQGVLGLSFTNSDALVAPHGGRRPAFGTNPISMAVRGAGGRPLLRRLRHQPGLLLQGQAPPGPRAPPGARLGGGRGRDGPSSPWAATRGSAWG